MILPEDDVEPPGPGAVVLGEPGVPEAIGAARSVFRPCQGERDALAPQLAVDEGPVRDRALIGRWQRLSPVQALFEGAVVHLGRQRPGEADLRGPLEVAADGGAGQACRDACLARAQALGAAEPQGFSDLAHGSTGTGHRHLSWGGLDAFQESVRCPRRLAPALPTTSARGGHYP